MATKRLRLTGVGQKLTGDITFAMWCHPAAISASGVLATENTLQISEQ